MPRNLFRVWRGWSFVWGTGGEKINTIYRHKINNENFDLPLFLYHPLYTFGYFSVFSGVFQKSLTIEVLKMVDITLISGIVIGVLVAIAGESFVRVIVLPWCMNPKLEIGEDSPHSDYHSIEIRNNGRSAAKGCVGSIRIEVKDPNDILHQGNAFVKKLTSRGVEGAVCWAWASNPPSITMNAYDKALLDVYAYSDKEKKIMIPSELGWNILRVCLKAKEYEGKLRITAENAKSAEKSFNLKVKGDDVIIEFK